MAVDERALVATLRNQQPGAFDQLYDHYRERVWAFTYRLVGNRPDAEDLFQDTWVAAARNAHRLEPDSRPLTWLYTIARNKHRNAIRFLVFDFNKRRSLALEPVTEAPMPDEHAETRRRLRLVQEIFHHLSSKDREVLILSVVEQLDTQQMGAVLGLGAPAVRKRLSRARKALVDLVESHKNQQRNADHE